MEQLTLEQEINRIPEVPDHYIEGEPDAYIEGWKVGMKEGAEWQKEQYKELLRIMEPLLTAYIFRYPDTDQLLAGYTNSEAINKIKMLHERIQDLGK
jgi:hypothetical protein